ncbi:hypothetical protein D9M70_329370 [compost metagenome]
MSRPRAILIAARSSGRPSRLLRSAPVTNSSISLPSWRVVPRTMAPAACSGVSVPFWSNSSGLRNASIRPISLETKFGLRRSMVSSSIEWPRRYTAWANSATMAGSMVLSKPLGARKTSTAGWILRANSSNTRCWYCISVPNLAAWNSRSPFHTRVDRSAGSWATSTASHWLRKAMSPVWAAAMTTALVCSTRRLCSAWNTWCTAVRPMFSLTRPSPAT